MRGASEQDLAHTSNTWIPTSGRVTRTFQMLFWYESAPAQAYLEHYPVRKHVEVYYARENPEENIEAEVPQGFG